MTVVDFKYYRKQQKFLTNKLVKTHNWYCVAFSVKFQLQMPICDNLNKNHNISVYSKTCIKFCLFLQYCWKFG